MRSPVLLSCAASVPISLLFRPSDAFVFHANNIHGNNYRGRLLSSRNPNESAKIDTIASTKTVPSTIPSRTTTKEERSLEAKQTWSTIALSSSPPSSLTLDLTAESTINNPSAFASFLKTHGTYYLNGLSSCQIGDRLMHPFEAHGYVKSLSFDGTGKLHLRKSVVKTPLTKKELDRNQPIAKGVMSSLCDTDTLPGQVKNMLAPMERDTANLVANIWPPPTSEAVREGRLDPMLIVATDNGAAFVLDPGTLEMKGTLSDALRKKAREDPSNLKYLEASADAVDTNEMLAHTRYDVKKDRFVMCTSKFDLPGDNNEGNTLLGFLEFDSDFRLISVRKYKSRFMVVHDWMMTDDYYVVPMNPATLKWGGLGNFIVGKGLGVDIFEMDQESLGEIILIPRDTTRTKIIKATADSFFTIFHFGPCFQQNSDELTVSGETEEEVVVYASIFDSYDFGGEMGFDYKTQQFDPIGWSDGPGAPKPRLDKFTIRTSDGKMTKRERIPILDQTTGKDIPIDMPAFKEDVGEWRYFYSLGASREEGWFPFRSVVKIDTLKRITHNWDAGGNRIVSEPLFIPRQPESAREDDGFVISIAHDATDKTCELIVWDAMLFDQGPIGSIALGPLVPWCVHGSWVPSFTPGIPL